MSGSSWFSIGYEHKLKSDVQRTTFISADYARGTGTITGVVLRVPVTVQTKGEVFYLMYGQRVRREGQRLFYEYAGGLVHSKASVTASDGITTDRDSESWNDLALSIGGGVELSDRVMLQLRYLWGDRPINEGFALSVGASF